VNTYTDPLDFVSRRDEVKSAIEEQFKKNVRGRIPDLTEYNAKHDGAEGDWLTKEMGLTVNGKNEPDYLGFEMKKQSIGKTTFGDWSPDVSIWQGINSTFNRDHFLSIFGSPNPLKGNRYSWSGRVFPKIGRVNDYGQSLEISKIQDVRAIYSHSQNRVLESRNLIPLPLQVEGLELAKWTHPRLKSRLERKFNQLGWFRCLKDNTGAYAKLQFGLPISIETFMPLFKAGVIYIDCGMHQNNPRPYMTFRASNAIWNKLAEKN